MAILVAAARLLTGHQASCTWSCLFPCQPSNVIERVAAWASARDSGNSQVVILEASLLSNGTCAFVPSYSSIRFDLIDVTLKGMDE
eukprot:1066238-Pelagomonas_calceolata.AAC.1